jgi:hypothetical protein
MVKLVSIGDAMLSQSKSKGATVENQVQPDYQGGGYSITPLSISNRKIKAPICKGDMSDLVFGGGVDTLEVGVGVDWDTQFLDDILPGILDAKKIAQESNKPQKLAYLGDEFEVNQLGWVTGRGQGQYYAGQTKWCGNRILFAKREKAGETTDNVRFCCSSLALMEADGLEPLWESFCLLITKLGGVIRWTKVSRVDGCVDIAGLHPEVIINDHLVGKVVTLARKDAVYRINRRATGLTVGAGGAVSLRVYSKLDEVANDERKRLVLERTRWQGQPECATRVEFQVRREALKRAGIDTVEDFYAMQGSLFKELSSSWYRMTKNDVDRNNTARAEVSELWGAIQDAFATWTGPVDREVKRPVRVPMKFETHKRMIIGCLMSTLSSKYVGTGVSLDINDFIREALKVVKESARNYYVESRFDARMASFAADGGVPVVPG